MAKQVTDAFANQAVIAVTESGANTLTFKKLETGISLFEKVAWIIHRIEWFLSTAVLAQFNSTADALKLAITTTDQLSDLLLANAAVLDLQYLQRLDIGAAASGILTSGMVVKDFSSLPGGGLIVPPNPLYGAAFGSGLAGATTTVVKLFYTNKQLVADEYWELVESRRIISSS